MMAQVIWIITNVPLVVKHVLRHTDMLYHHWADFVPYQGFAHEQCAVCATLNILGGATYNVLP